MTTTLQNIAKTVAPVMRKYGIKRASLYGSFARGNERPDSDVDLLIDFGTGSMGMFAYMRLVNEMERVLHRKVDIVTRESMSPYMRPSIEKDLTTIYES